MYNQIELTGKSLNIISNIYYIMSKYKKEDFKEEISIGDINIVFSRFESKIIGSGSNLSPDQYNLRLFLKIPDYYYNLSFQNSFKDVLLESGILELRDLLEDMGMFNQLKCDWEGF
jgi:hypothetical protein